MKLFELFAVLGLDNSDFKSKMSSSKTSFSTFATSISGTVKTIGNVSSSVINTMESVITKSTMVASGIATALAKVGITYNSQIEDYTTNFATLLGSTEAAVERVEELKTMAAKTPFAMSDLASATQTLLSFQVPANKTNTVLKQLGDIALGDKTKLSGLAVVFGQVSSAGKLQGQDLMQMINQGFNPLNFIAERTGETMEELRDRMSDGKITAEEVTQAIADATSEGAQFYNGMENASKTTSGLFSTLKDDATALVGQALTPLSNWVRDSLLPTTEGYVQRITEAFSEGTDATKETLLDIIQEVLGNLDSLLTEVVPKVESFFQSFFDILNEVTPTLLEVGSNIIGYIVDGMNTFLPQIAELAGQIAPMVITSIFTLKAQLLDGGIKVIAAIVDGMYNNLDKVVAMASNVVSTLLNTVSTYLPTIITKGLDILLALMEGIAEHHEQITTTITNVINAIVTWLGNADNVNTLLNAGWDVLSAIAKGLYNAIADPDIDLVGKILSFIDTIVTFISDNWDTLLDAGMNIVKAIANGLWNNRDLIIDIFKKIMSLAINNALSGGIFGDSWKYGTPWDTSSLPDLILPSGYATGIDYVPYDNFDANLHLGEAVLTKSEAEDWRSGNTQPAQSTQPVDESSLATLADMMADRFASAMEKVPVLLDRREVGRFVREVTA